ncbi:MAG: alpha/beta hydrolase family protein [Bryobacteraceae bacterium]
MRTIVLWLSVAVVTASTQPALFQTPEGIRYGLIGAKPAQPAPLLIVMAGSVEGTLTSPYNDVGRILANHGFLQVALDLPSHGKDQGPDVKNSLRAWRDRLEKGEDFVTSFLARVSKVVDHLVAGRYADPKRIYVAGTSRGGFMAIHYTAYDSRVRATAAFGPVTDLLALREFEGMEYHARTRALTLARLAEMLRDRRIWVWMGTTDHRVNTQSAIDFVMRVVESAEAAGVAPRIELHLHPSEGHRTNPHSHQEAADWFLKQ